MALLDEYSDKIRSTVANVILRENENKKLEDLRDWLLPMLMNGQIKVE